MPKQQKGDANSLLYSYYTLAHPTSQQRDSSSPLSSENVPKSGNKRHDSESGDETDKSAENDNEVTESFFMDEINVNTMSCSLSASRENLHDGGANQVGVRDSRNGNRRNSWPFFTKRTPVKTSELPVDERIKALEDGLKEADLEREVVLSCLGKEYLERVTMQNYLQEICKKSGYVYEDVKANVQVQSEAENILEDMIEMRSKALLRSKSKDNGVTESPANGINLTSIPEGIKQKGNTKQIPGNNEPNIIDIITEEKLREFIAKVIQTEQERLRTERKGDGDIEKNSHTQTTKSSVISNASALEGNNSTNNGSVGDEKIEGFAANKGITKDIVIDSQSIKLSLSADKTTVRDDMNEISEGEELETTGIVMNSQSDQSLLSADKTTLVEINDATHTNGGTRKTNITNNQSVKPLIAADKTTAVVEISGASTASKSTTKGIVPVNQSDKQIESADHPLLSANTVNNGHEKNSKSQNYEKATKSFCAEQFKNPEALETRHKQLLSASVNMPSMSDKQQSKTDTFQSLDNITTAKNKSLDSIDEGIYMLKALLTELLERNKRTPGRIRDVQLVEALKPSKPPGCAGKTATVAKDNKTGQVKAKRELSMNKTPNGAVKADFKLQRSRSFAEGMDSVKNKTADNKTTESRLFRATVASQSKMKDKIARRDAESDTETAKKTSRNRQKKHNMTRSASDIRDTSRTAYASTEDESSIDGDDDLRSIIGKPGDTSNKFEYIYEIDQQLTNKEYTKIFSILNMLEDQKRKWEDEVRALKVKISDLENNNSDLSHDNSVLRKSLEAANHAIKEINAKVQELKLTIVPLRNENSKLRDQNHSLKSKLDLLRKDKAMLLQEYQELKKTKLKYEEKLQLVTDLYQNGRINLPTDQNNNYPTEANVKFAKGGLKYLLEINDDRGKANEQSRQKTDKSNEQSRSNAAKPIESRSSKSNLDRSKRHSFHGFERIEELAGNAEEIIAEKEKYEEENSVLKKELSALKEQMVEDRKQNVISDEEALNRRRGWRMQREESKHRIIREILKTESSQARYNRPYSSCGDLTITENEGSSRRMWGEGKQEGKKSSTRGVDPQATSSLNRDKSKQDAQNSKESAKDQRDRGYAAFEADLKNRKKDNSSISWKEESKRIAERIANFRFASASKPDTTKQEVGSLEGTKKDRDIGDDDEQDGQSKGSESLDRDGSRPSTQWPIVKEKIKEIYGLPVDFANSFDDEDDNNHDYKDGKNHLANRPGSKNKQRYRRDGSDVSEYARYEQETEVTREVSGRQRQSLPRPNERRASLQEMVARHVVQAEEESLLEREYSQSDWNKMESEWQIKSSDGENDFETYREITKQRQQAKKRFKQSSRSKSARSIEHQAMNESNSTSQARKDGDKKATSGDFSSETVSLKNGITSGRVNAKQSSPWVEVPVYFKKGEQEKKLAKKSSKASGKHEYQSEKTKFVEEMITNVDSAFTTTSQNLVKKQEKTTKNRYMKDGREFVRRSPGTVMYLDELSDTDSDEYERPKTIPRRSKSFRRPRPKSDYWASERVTENDMHSSGIRRNASLKLPKKTRDDMFAVNISIDAETDMSFKAESSTRQHEESTARQHEESIIKHRQSSSTKEYTDLFDGSVQSTRSNHYHEHHHGNNYDSQSRSRVYSETGTSNTRQPKPKSPGGFSCEMCRELNKRKIAQEKYCWEKYFPIGETTIDGTSKGYKEDYV